MQFWKPGTQGPGSTVDRATESEDVIVPSAPASAALGIQAQREQLPIFKHSKLIRLILVRRFEAHFLKGTNFYTASRAMV